MNSRRFKMFKKVAVCLILVLFLTGCSGSDSPSKDPMRNWGTKKSTAEPMKDFPGGPQEKK
jgi:PBP1b-binding outer membrane lipoprotein LpoB